MRKPLCLFILFSLAMGTTLLVSPKNAEATIDRCPRHDVKTSLKAKRKKTVFQRASFKDINDYLNSHGVLAYVAPQLQFKLRYRFDFVNVGQGRYCVRLEEVQGLFLAANTIVMPADYEKKSCEYKIILEHEKRHLRENYIYHEENTKKFETYLGRIAKDVPVFPPVDSEKDMMQVQASIREYFSSRYSELVDASLAELDKLQSKIDSPQEYLYTNRRIDRCSKLEEENERANSKVFNR